MFRFYNSISTSMIKQNLLSGIWGVNFASKDPVTKADLDRFAENIAEEIKKCYEEIEKIENGPVNAASRLSR